MVDRTDAKPIRIVQITDSHLFKNPDACLVGLNTRDSFSRVLSLVKQQQTDMDLILATGDIAQDASPEAYQYFAQGLSQFHVPHYWIPGNHDKLDVMVKSLPGANVFDKKIRLGNWQIILLNTREEGATHGKLADGELEFLQQCLAESDDAEFDIHNLICLHHNPVPVNCKWMQNIGLHNSADFLQIVDKHTNIAGILWGHIHQNWDTERNGVRMMASPSTCIQFKPDVIEFSLDTLNPGYRWLELYPDGSLDSGVERVSNHKFTVDFSSTGY